MRQEIIESLDEGVKQALELLETAMTDISVETTSIRDTGQRKVDSDQRKILGGAEVAARNKSLQLVEQTINRVFDTTLSNFEKKASGRDYDKALKRFLEESVVALGSDNVRVEANSRDLQSVKKLARRIGQERQVEIRVETKAIKCIGGIRASSTDGSMIFDNTIEARLSRWKPLLRKRIAELIS